MKIQQSAAESADNTGEWEAVLRLVGSGEGRFVTSLTLPASNGQRAKCVDAEERIFVSDFDWENRETKDSITPVFDMREVGTIFEVDPVLSDDRRTVDLKLSFEHHSAPPTLAMTTVTLPGGSQPVEVATPVFHAKKIVTQLSMKFGETRLLGLWRPTGKPEFESRDVMHVAFLMADLNTVLPPAAEPVASTPSSPESK
ncbi:MAG: hypothetical protein KDM63_15655 [Verrucomicrobiae bacterium]|nr:hypothetical protein [Verrucomicrobiae bacterium]